MFALMNYDGRPLTRYGCRRLLVSAQGWNRTSPSPTRYWVLRADVLGLVDPLSSGAIPQWHPADRQPHTQTTYRELEPHPLGAGTGREIAARFPPVRNFPHWARRQVYGRGTAPSVAFATRFEIFC